MYLHRLFVIALIANYKEGEQQDAAEFYTGLIQNLIDLQKTMERLTLAMQIARCENINSYFTYSPVEKCLRMTTEVTGGFKVTNQGCRDGLGG